METNAIYKDGAIIRRSRNLRGMRDYARISPVVRIETRREHNPVSVEVNKVRGQLDVTYADGATCRASFASYHVMIDWVRNRRSWRDAQWVKHDEDMGYFTKPGIIAGASDAKG